MRPWPPTEPPIWELSGFWAGAYLVVMLLVVLGWSLAKDRESRKPLLRRVLLVAAGLWILLHAWSAADLSLQLAMARPPRGWERVGVFHEAIRTSAIAWALLGATLAAVAVTSGPPGATGRAFGLALAAASGTFAFGPSAPIRGRLASADPGHYVLETGPSSYADPTWIDGVCIAGGYVAFAAAVALLVTLVSRSTERLATLEERSRTLRDRLAFWGGMLLAGSVLALERKAMTNLDFSVLVMSRTPGRRGGEFQRFLGECWPWLLLAFSGLIALTFGGLHLRAGRPARADAR